VWLVTRVVRLAKRSKSEDEASNKDSKTKE
jgi:hypothetical protein